MMKKNILYSVLLSSAAAVSSCAGFLDEYSQNEAYVEKVSDLQEVVLGEAYLQVTKEIQPNLLAVTDWSAPINNPKAFFPWIHILDDDAAEFAVRVRTSAALMWLRDQTIKAHHWQPVPLMNYDNVEKVDENWGATYKRIASLNSVLYQLELLRSGEPDEELCNRVEGESRFLRAYYYFWLANLYAKPYCKTTADTDPCIPLKVSESVLTTYFPRDPASVVYGRIVDDLERAIVCLEGIRHTKVNRASQAAAYALLSRVSLYMENYSRAVECADEVIGMTDYGLLDLNGHVAGTNVTYRTSPETIFTQGNNCMGALHSLDNTTATGTLAGTQANCYTSSPDLLACFDATDLRRAAFFIEATITKGAFRCIKWRDGGV